MAPHTEFVEIRLANDDRAARTKLGHDRRLERTDVVQQKRRGACRGRGGGRGRCDVVLDGQGEWLGVAILFEGLELFLDVGVGDWITQLSC